MTPKLNFIPVSVKDFQAATSVYLQSCDNKMVALFDLLVGIHILLCEQNNRNYKIQTYKY